MHSRRASQATGTGSSLPSPGVVPREPVFEMVVLGCGGGPLETDCSGYIVKPARSRWEDGILALEGGSGIGALAALLKLYPADKLFPTVDFPATHHTPVLKSAYIFSFLTCYLITHAHLDHAVSLIMLSGSVPPRGKPPSPRVSTSASTPPDDTAPPLPMRIPVYGTRTTLDNLAGAYGGGLWPELGEWANETEASWNGRRKRRRVEDENPGVGAKFSPLTAKQHMHLHATLPISAEMFPLSHGSTSHGPYASSAAFLRYDPSLLSSQPASRRESLAKLSTPPDENMAEGPTPDGVSGHEFLFLGDMEGGWRAHGQEDIDKEAATASSAHNLEVWQRAAESFNRGTLAGIFLECSYDSSRSAEMMYGHLSPPGILHEMKTLAKFAGGGPRPLEGLRIFITHIKEFLVPHRSGLTARELIRSQLEALEAEHQLGIMFIFPQPGDRLLI